MKDILIQYFAGVIFVLVVCTVLEIYIGWEFVFLALFLLAGNLVGFMIRMHYLEKK